ncbi:IM protein of oligopeptide ABC transporter (OPN:undef) [Propionibacterium freudenreichii]|nr:IM protein of oligopeptide ABC transporter (OPN:undef) [Propionibacterium freudenreichii]CEI46866.1 IM protein of oligopeptide ABC transporter (OPN:undef) [Propionibacterium freudenreichii]
MVVRTASHDSAHPVQEATAASQNVMTPTRGLADNATESDAAEQSRTARRPRGAGVIKYLLRRVLGWIGMIFLATNLTYFLANLFLDPKANYLERNPPIPDDQIDRMLHPYNLDPTVSLIDRWWTWLQDVLLHWNWGMSPDGQAVNTQVAFRVWNSAQLMLGATILACAVGIAVGVYTASRQYKLGDRIFQAISIVAMNTHIVVASMVAVIVAIAINGAAGQRIFFVTGSASIGVHGFFPVLLDKAQHLILPTLCLLFINYASYHFMQRSLLLDNINADYVRTARAKGLTKPQAIRRHALRTSIIPVATQVAFAIPGIFTGAVLTEKIFGWQGMGDYFVTTIAKNDIHGVVAVAAFAAAMTAVGAILADIFVVLLDPRVKVS